MWIGERITEKGVGNGISIVLLINILSSIPADITGLFEMFVKGKTLDTEHSQQSLSLLSFLLRS